MLAATQRGFSRLNPLQRSMFSAVSALLGYGAWAYLVNAMHGPAAAMKAACVQGGYSFAITFVMTLLIEVLYRLVASVFEHGIMTKSVTVIVTCAIIFSGSWWVNAMAGTPEIFSTVILGYVIGAIYTTSYVFGLSNDKARRDETVQTVSPDLTS